MQDQGKAISSVRVVESQIGIGNLRPVGLGAAFTAQFFQSYRQIWPVQGFFQACFDIRKFNRGIEPFADLGENPHVVTRFGRRRQCRSDMLDVFVQIRPDDVLLLEHQCARQYQIRPLGSVVHEGIHNHLKLNAFKGTRGLAGVRRLVDRVDSVDPDQLDRRIVGSLYFASDGGNRERSPLFFPGTPGPVQIQIAVGMQVKIAAAPGNPDMAGKKRQGIDKAHVFTAIAVALQPSSDKCGCRPILPIPAQQFFDIRRADFTGTRQVFQSPTGY